MVVRGSGDEGRGKALLVRSQEGTRNGGVARSGGIATFKFPQQAGQSPNAPTHYPCTPALQHAHRQRSKKPCVTPGVRKAHRPTRVHPCCPQLHQTKPTLLCLPRKTNELPRKTNELPMSRAGHRRHATIPILFEASQHAKYIRPPPYRTMICLHMYIHTYALDFDVIYRRQKLNMYVRANARNRQRSSTGRQTPPHTCRCTTHRPQGLAS